MYQGMGGESGGVVGMLEVIEQDFARLEAETSTSEAAGVKEYETFMSDSKVDHAGKSKDIEHKTAKKEEEEKALVTKKADVEGNQKELDAALAYFDKLKPTCIGEAESYEDRVARRKEETIISSMSIIIIISSIIMIICIVVVVVYKIV